MSVLHRNSSSHSIISGVSSVGQKPKSSMSTRSISSSTKTNLESAAVYATNCIKYKTRPMTCVKFNSKTNSIEIWGDRMKANDWKAAMETLRADVIAHSVCIKNKRFTGNLETSYDTLSSAMEAPKKVQASGTLFVTREIASSVYNVLINSQALVCLELENVTFDIQALKMLINGINTNRMLQHLSLAYGHIGDDVCLALCKILRYKPNILSVNMTGCSLTAVSGNYGLVDVIKKQQYKRHEECWAHSLRSSTANPNIMLGLRRLTLNDNPKLGDDGVAELFEALKDDLFVKAVDLQNCGLTDRGAEMALSMLTFNDTLVVLDMRKNALMSASALEMVMGQLYKNNADKSETKLWKWTKIERDNESVSSTTLY